MFVLSINLHLLQMDLILENKVGGTSSSGVPREVGHGEGTQAQAAWWA